MPDLSLFGTEEHPLRASSLDTLVRCPWRTAMTYLGLYPDDSSAAADTGSAAHRAVEHWHKTGRDAAKALRAMREGLGDYPLADLHDAELSFRPYAEDPRNQEADVVLVERKVRFALHPSASDPTGQLIWVKGTLDQVRRQAGRLYLWDLKTGMPEGWDMLHSHLFQVLAYCVGATEALGEPVHPGGLIRTRGYRKRGKLPVDPPGVFWNYTITHGHCDKLLDAVRRRVAEVRRGTMLPGPGEHCRHCPARGIDECVPKLFSLPVTQPRSAA